MTDEHSTADNDTSTASWLRLGLWRATGTVAAQARRCGAISSIATRPQRLTDNGLQFVVRIIENLAHKAQARASQQPSSGSNFNPFLPYDPGLFVGDIGAQHVALLNKYNVVSKHLLIVTREFQSQDTCLALGDFVALARCMTAAEIEPLAFYNSGQVAGASQTHKHLQLIPLLEEGRSPEDSNAPLDSVIGASVAHNQFGASDRLPFAHSVAGIPEMSPAELPRELHALYLELLKGQQLAPIAEAASSKPRGPYNLLLTRRWMLLVPRRCESFHGISLNALAFGGALLVRDENQLDVLRRVGPLAALRHVAK
jgi:ATP adenylyltransferase